MLDLNQQQCARSIYRSCAWSLHKSTGKTLADCFASCENIVWILLRECMGSSFPRYSPLQFPLCHQIRKKRINIELRIKRWERQNEILLLPKLFPLRYSCDRERGIGMALRGEGIDRSQTLLCLFYMSFLPFLWPLWLNYAFSGIGHYLPLAQVKIKSIKL